MRCAQLLVLCGARPYWHDKSDKTPLQLAHENGYRQCAKKLERTILELAELTVEQKAQAIKKSFSDVAYLFAPQNNEQARSDISIPKPNWFNNLRNLFSRKA